MLVANKKGDWDFVFYSDAWRHQRAYRMYRYQHAREHVQAARNTLVYDTIGLTVLGGHFTRFYMGMKILAAFKRHSRSLKATCL